MNTKYDDYDKDIEVTKNQFGDLNSGNFTYMGDKNELSCEVILGNIEMLIFDKTVITRNYLGMTMKIVFTNVDKGNKKAYAIFTMLPEAVISEEKHDFDSSLQSKYKQVLFEYDTKYHMIIDIGRICYNESSDKNILFRLSNYGDELLNKYIKFAALSSPKTIINTKTYLDKRNTAIPRDKNIINPSEITKNLEYKNNNSALGILYNNVYSLFNIPSTPQQKPSSKNFNNMNNTASAKPSRNKNGSLLGSSSISSSSTFGSNTSGSNTSGRRTVGGSRVNRRSSCWGRIKPTRRRSHGHFRKRSSTMRKKKVHSRRRR